MINKEILLNHIEDKSLKEVSSLVLDKVEGVLRKYDIRSTDFLNPYENKTASSVLNAIEDINYCITGGYSQAERKTIVIFPNYLEEEMIDLPLSAIEIENTSHFDKLSHPDYLGAILGIGLKREKIGDLIVDNNICQVIVDKEIKDYIIYNLDKVSRVSVKVKEIGLDEINPPQIEYQVISGNVASLRLDSILSRGYKLSRAEAQNLISKSGVSVNWQQIEKTSYEIEEGDLISVKGKGRVKLASIEGKTKSGRTVVKLHKII